MKTPQEQALEAFEKWYSQGNKFCPSLQKTENRGEGKLPYRLMQTQVSWDAFKAGYDQALTSQAEKDRVMELMAEALENVQSLIAKNSEHGFVVENHLMQLFESNQKTSKALTEYAKLKEQQNER